MLAWLEKQKEQKGLDVTDYCQPIHPDIAKVLPDVINNLTWKEDEQKEQKPAEWDELQSEFKNINGTDWVDARDDYYFIQDDIIQITNVISRRTLCDYLV